MLFRIKLPFKEPVNQTIKDIYTFGSIALFEILIRMSAATKNESKLWWVVYIALAIALHRLVMQRILSFE